MGFRGAAQGFRGAAPWGFEEQHHGVSRGSNKWDGTSRGGAGVSRHSNMGQGYRGDIFYMEVAICTWRSHLTFLDKVTWSANEIISTNEKPHITKPNNLSCDS